VLPKRPERGPHRDGAARLKWQQNQLPLLCRFTRIPPWRDCPRSFQLLGNTPATFDNWPTCFNSIAFARAGFHAASAGNWRGMDFRWRSKIALMGAWLHAKAILTPPTRCKRAGSSPVTTTRASAPRPGPRWRPPTPATPPPTATILDPAGRRPHPRRLRDEVRGVLRLQRHRRQLAALASLCQSYHSILCHELAHVETDECGAPEFFSNGTKVLTVPAPAAR